MNNSYLTRRAFVDIQRIYDYSQENWGDAKADEYVNKLYKDFMKIANNTELGKLRKTRLTPFLMYPSGRHYIVYELFKDDVIIITILHQVRNIENIVQEFGSIFYNEIETLKSDIDS